MLPNKAPQPTPLQFCHAALLVGRLLAQDRVGPREVEVKFEAHAIIHRWLEDVFGLFRDIDQHAGQEGSVVPVYYKTTPGPVGVGTRYREVVRLLPFLRGEVITAVIGCDPPRRLDYR